MKISEEAVEVAAKAAYIADNLGWGGAEAAWDDMGGAERSFERAGWEITARAALEAAAPLLMAQALREVLAWAEEHHPWIGLMDLKDHIEERASELEGK